MTILLNVNINPLNGPYFFIDSFEYCEHVGENLHLGAKKGEISFIGDTHRAINEYISENTFVESLPGKITFDENSIRYGTGDVRIISIEII